MTKELDVPHWAMSAVVAWRTRLILPKEVTDRMIYARLLEVPMSVFHGYIGNTESVYEAALEALRKEVMG